MARFLVGVLIGIAMAVGYVRYDSGLPGWLQLSERLRGNLVSTAIEGDLYDLDRDAAARRRALEVYFDNRAADAARVDGEAGHPFLEVLYRRRAAHEARLLLGEWTAYDAALAKPALRAGLEKRHGTADTEALKAHMLADGLAKKPFLVRWLAREGEAATGDLRARLKTLAAR